jgi:hypothetical protein
MRAKIPPRSIRLANPMTLPFSPRIGVQLGSMSIQRYLVAANLSPQVAVSVTGSHFQFS